MNDGKTLEQYAQDYAANRRTLTEEEKEYNESRLFHEKAGELKEHWNKVKALREEIKQDLKDQKNRIKKLKNDMKLQEEMITLRLREQQLSFFEVPSEGTFKLTDKLKYKKFRKRKLKRRF